MTAPWPFDEAKADAADGRPVIGYLSAAAPVELIRAAGARPLLVEGDPADDTPDALDWLEPCFDGWALSLFQRMIDGRLAHLSALVVPRFSEVMLQLYYNMLEYRRQTAAAIPEPILADILHTPFAATRDYNLGRMHALGERLGRITGRAPTADRLAKANVEGDALREGLSRLNARRTDPNGPRLTGAAMMAATAAAGRLGPGRVLDLVRDVLDAPPGPVRTGRRVMLTGSPQAGAGLHRALEAGGDTVTADDHGSGDWAFLDRIGAGEPFAALAAFCERAPSLRSFPRATIDARFLAAVERGRPDLVVFVTEAHDDALGFDYPTQRALLATRGIASVFLPEQSWRHPDRGAQAAAVRAALAEVAA